MTKKRLTKPDNGLRTTDYGLRTTDYALRTTHYALRIDGNTQLIGLLGWPLSHTFSPAMHNAAAAAAGLNWVYLPLSVPPDEVETAVRGLPALSFRGVNVTVPHKQAVMPFLDEIETGAQAIGAVNTIVVERPINNQQLTINNVASRPLRVQQLTRAARLVGYNTDWSGFLKDLAAYGVDAAGRDCVILGAGGSARAVAYGLAAQGARVTMLARRYEQAEEVVERLRPYFPDAFLQTAALTDLAGVVQNSDAPLIVNCTPLGMSPHAAASPWPDELPFPPGSFVYDLVYNPQQTKLMQQAQAAGCRTENGLGMLAQQGAAAFRLWTGVEPDVDVMRSAIDLKG